MKEEIEQEKMIEMKPSEENKANPYQKVVLNNVHKDEIKIKQHKWKVGLYGVTMSSIFNMMKDQRPHTI